ncbi:MAG: DsbA family protein [Gemmatimonadetes bacterium]|nr:DsbA family protein [Gemmatimonadota bacterium]
MPFTLYSDFTTAECYALNEQIASLGVGASVRWKGVQHAPGMPEPMRTFDRRGQDQMADEVEMIRRIDPALAIHVPAARPNSSKAIVAAAAVMLKAAARAPGFRDAIYRAYWRDGVDISSMAELHRLADQAGVPRFVDLSHPDGVELAEEWDLDWSTERLGGVPRVIRGDGKILWGFRPHADAAQFFSGASTGGR